MKRGNNFRILENISLFNQNLARTGRGYINLIVQSNVAPPTKISARFFAAVLCGFCASIILVFCVSRQMNPLNRLARGIPAEFIFRDTLFGKSRAQAHAFPLVDFDGHYLGIRALDFPDLFSSLYPGYEAARTDDELWDRYFNGRALASFLWSPALDHSEVQHPMFLSFEGAHLVYAKYGADLLIYGSSETALGLVPQTLAHRLHSAGVYKVLPATRPTALVDTVRRSANWLAQQKKPKAKIALWGYSGWNAFLRGDALVAAAKEQAEIVIPQTGRQKIRPGNELAARLTDFRNNLNWNHVMPASFQVIRNHWSQSPARAGPLEFKQEPGQDGFVFSTEALRNPENLAQIGEMAQPHFAHFVGINESDCDLRSAARDLDEALVSLKAVAENIFIYLTPVTPLVTKYVPACYWKNLRTLLLSRRGPRVFVNTGDWQSYGLNWGDFAREFSPGYSYTLDANHTNFRGAQKVTLALSHWINSALKAETR